MATIEKSHLVKVFRAGTFLGILDNVVSEFRYNQNINTSGSQLQITVGRNVDIQQGALEAIQTEAGEDLLTEDGEVLYTERAADQVGPGTLIDNNNDIEVYVVSAEDPNGKLVFSGYISTWTATFGEQDVIEITVLSHGIDLDDFLIMSGPGDNAALSQPDSDSEWGFATGGPFETQKVAQTFQVPTTGYYTGFEVALESAIDPGDYLDASFYVGTPSSPGTVIHSETSRFVPYDNNSYTFKAFQFDAPTLLTAGVTYTIELTATEPRPSSAGPAFYVRTLNSNVLSTGSFWNGYDDGVSFVWDADTDYDVAFKVFAAGGSPTSTFTDQDPADILRILLELYQDEGGVVTYNGSSIDDTGESVTYTFKLNTMLEGVKKLLELSPEDFYWFVDPSNSRLYFKQQAATPAHVFILGQHIQSLIIDSTVENVRNVVAFSGGDDGSGESLLSIYENEDSIEDNAGRRRLERLSDNRVTLQDTADRLANDVLSRNAGEVYRNTLTILASKYDIDSIQVGDMVGFAGFNSLVDTLLLQVVGLERTPDYAVLSLGVLKPRPTEILETARRDIIQLQTVDASDVPSE